MDSDNITVIFLLVGNYENYFILQTFLWFFSGLYIWKYFDGE